MILLLRIVFDVIVIKAAAAAATISAPTAAAT
jgi:hypothetical protein